jgi:hypothetical protein
MLQDYLARKSALSLGYKRVYVETPPPELDQAITARARRALRWLLPGVLAALIALTFIVGLNVGVGKWVNMMVSAERTVNRLEKERKEKAEKERLEAPVSVFVDANSMAKSPAAEPQLSREAWLAKIEQLKKTGTAAQVEAELRSFRAAYPDK